MDKDEYIEGYILEDVIENGEDLEEPLEELNDHPDTLEELLVHFESMYNKFKDANDIARFALGNVIEIRRCKILKDHCDG